MRGSNRCAANLSRQKTAMAEIVGIFACSHAPQLVRDWETIEKGRRSRLERAFLELGRAIAAAETDVVVAIGPDHWSNFFLSNMPAICIGVGAHHGGPPEPWLSAFPHRTLPGDARFGTYLADYAFTHGFEPSISHRMNLDHGFCVPLWRTDLDPLPAIVPVVINAIQTPVPSIARCIAFGAMIADAAEHFAEPTRVAVLASGGLSHSVGEPTMWEVDEAFDRMCIERFAEGDPASIIAQMNEDRIARAGNGSSEVRYWTVAHGAARCRGFELMHYEVVPEVGTGCGFARWISV